MTSGPAFLIAARRCEIHALAALRRTAALVRRTADCVHALQRERGLSNLWLGSGRAAPSAELAAQLPCTDGAIAALRGALDRLDADAHHAAAHGARLFSRIAYALQGLDALPGLRGRVAARASDGTVAVRDYSQLVAALLAVVFEAADSASDPAITRLLVALFQLLQGQEFAGQERATGAAAFGAGAADAALLAHWQHLVDSQARCFAVFADFAGPDAVAALQAAETQSAAVQALRHQAWAGSVRAADSPAWFAACSARIDGMHRVVQQLAGTLEALCDQRIAETEADLQARSAELAGTAAPGAFFAQPVPPGAASGLGPQLERSVLALVQEQAQRLQAMGDELATARASLDERKVVERAKGLLMAHRKFSEAEAHKMLRTTAMNQNRRLVDVAESVLAMADYL